MQDHHITAFKQELNQQHSSAKPQKQPINTPQDTFTSSYYFNQNNDWHEGNDQLHFARNGVSPRTLKKLKQGALRLEGFLDLHGKTIIEAAALLEQFIQNHAGPTSVCLLVVHGKGNQSKDGKAVIKNNVAHWLKHDPHVLAYHSALGKDGGNGALYVLTKKSR